MNDSIIKTTVNLRLERFQFVSLLAKQYGIQLQKLIKLCVDRYSAKIRSSEFQSGARKYQPRGGIWHTEHLELTEMEYGMYLDLQHHSKCCLSLIVALALDEFAEIVLSDEEKNSYLDKAYVQYYTVNNNYPIYVNCWGLPRTEIEIKLPFLE
jgi:hypothetical protein